jgi:hypothetical protein
VRTLRLTNAWRATSGGIATFYRALLRAAETERCHVALVVPSSSDGLERTGEYGRIHHVRAPIAPLTGAYRWLTPG